MTRSLPSDWGYRREEVLEKYGRECANCGRPGEREGSRLEVHHIVPREAGGTHKLSNLAPLCVPCHFAAHYTDTQAPTGGPTIDYDKMAEAWHTPPENRSEAQEKYLTQVAQKLYEYAEGEEYQYYPSANKNDNQSTPSNPETLCSTEDAPSDLWNHLQAKWSAER